MKTLTIIAAIVFAAITSRADLSNAVFQARSNGVQQTGLIANWLAECTASSSSNRIDVITNNLTDVSLLTYLANNAPSGVTSSSTPAQIRTAWSNAVASAASSNKPAVLGEQAIWMPAWFVYRTTTPLPALNSNSVSVSWCLTNRWQTFGLDHAPTGAEIEALH